MPVEGTRRRRTRASNPVARLRGWGYRAGMSEELTDLPLFAEPVRALEARAALDGMLTDTELRALATVHEFSLVCTVCDADAPGTLDEALRLGWNDIVFDDGPGWNFLGLCPDCLPGL
jgi:hypothetical protein